MSTVGSVAQVMSLHESLMSMVLPVPVKAGNARQDDNRMTNDDTSPKPQVTDCGDILPLNFLVLLHEFYIMLHFILLTFC